MLLDLIFPKQCLNCFRWGHYICVQCAVNLKTTLVQRCIVCQKPSSHGYTHSKCKTKDSPERLVTIFQYSDPLISKSINSAKLSLIPSLFEELTDLSITFIELKYPLLYTFTLCSIPIHRNKYLYRGFNQSEIIAKGLSKQLSLPIDNFLSKQKRTTQQKTLKKESRLTNLKDSFLIKEKGSLPKLVLLVDDVTTTGTTFMEATKTIKNAGVSTVWCFALAQD